jgi:hypothetical protein
LLSLDRSSLGTPVPPALLACVFAPDDPLKPMPDMLVDCAVGADGVRALCAALLGRGSPASSAGAAIATRPPAYKHVRSLRLWRTGCGDVGAAAVADLLTNGREDVALEAVDIADCGVGVDGCAALGAAVMLGANSGSLKTLRLDLNAGIGDAGGLRGRFGGGCLCGKETAHAPVLVLRRSVAVPRPWRRRRLYAVPWAGDVPLHYKALTRLLRRGARVRAGACGAAALTIVWPGVAPPAR